MRRLVLWFFPFFSAGILLQGEVSLLVAGAVVAALFFILLVKKHVYTGVFCLLFLGLGYLTASLSENGFERRYEYLKNCSISGNGSGYSGYVLDRNENSLVIRNKDIGYKIGASFYNGTDAVPGDYITFEAIINEKPDYRKRIMCSKGIDGYVSAKYGRSEIRRNENLLMLPYRLRYSINSQLTRIDPEGGSFISGLVTGNIEQLGDDTVENFQNLGISHILAVSGFNLGIIYFSILRATTHTRLSAKLRYVLTMLICFVYTAMGAFEPSVFRAFIMIFIALAAKLLNRQHDVLAGITLAAWVMLVINPYYIYNIGFLLSFAATYGIIMLERELEDRIPARLSKFKGEIAVSFAAFLATFPIMLWFRGFFSAVTLAVNILIGPFTVLITLVSFVVTILFCLTGAVLFLYPAVFAGIVFIKIINFVSSFNILVFTGMPPMLFIAVYYLILAICFDFIPLRLGNRKKTVVVAVGAAVMLVFMQHGGDQLKIHYINVGQGESVFIETPNKKGILIDTGPSVENFSALKKRVIPYFQRLGYNSLSAVVFTHFHNDHAGDYQYLLDKYQIGKLFCCKSPSGSKHQFTELSKGDRVALDGVVIDILYPDGSNVSSDDKNEECLVLHVTYRGFSMLIPGDVEASVMEKIQGKFDVFNLSHHGSVKSFSIRMVDESKLGIAVVSVGKNNFGHPSTAVLDYLGQKGIPVYRTDKQGTVTIITDGYKYQTLFQ